MPKQGISSEVYFMSSKRLFLKTPPVRLFFMAALPGAAGMLASMLYSIIDGVLVGNLLGMTAFAAISLGLPFIIINFSLADLIGVGSSVPIALYLGQKKDEQANNIFTCSCLMIVGAGIIIGAALFVFAPSLLALLGAKGELARLAADYVRVYALFSPVTTIVFALDNYLRISGKIRLSMWLNIIMSVSIAVLEFVFLYIFRWGLWSAAFAACLSMTAAAVAALYPFMRGRLQLRFVCPHFNLPMIRQIFACGTPSFLNNIAGRITAVALNVGLLRFGGEAAVAVYGILVYFGDIVQSLLYGIYDSLQPAIGYNWGAGRRDRVLVLSWCCLGAGAFLSLVAVAVTFLFPRQLTALFSDNDSAMFVSMAILALKLYGISYLVRWFSFFVLGFMTAVGHVWAASAISLASALVFPLLLLALLWPLELFGLWLNFSGSALLTFIFSIILLCHFNKKVNLI